jgi:hypothetical protein
VTTTAPERTHAPAQRAAGLRRNDVLTGIWLAALTVATWPLLVAAAGPGTNAAQLGGSRRAVASVEKLSARASWEATPSG